MPGSASTKDGELSTIEKIARSRGMQPWETQALVEALTAARRGMGDLQVQTERLRWQLGQNGVDPSLIDIGVRLLQGDFRGDAQAAQPGQLSNAAKEITGPAPGKRAQLAGRAADFMQDQRADTFQYQQPDLNRPRPRAADPAASIQFAAPNGATSEPLPGTDPTPTRPYEWQGPLPPEIPTNTPRLLGTIQQPGLGDRRIALYGELDKLIQGRTGGTPAPNNLRGAMSDAYVLEQMIPALRERYVDRPDVLQRLDAIQLSMARDPLVTPVMDGIDSVAQRVGLPPVSGSSRNLSGAGAADAGKAPPFVFMSGESDPDVPVNSNSIPDPRPDGKRTTAQDVQNLYQRYQIRTDRAPDRLPGPLYNERGELRVMDGVDIRTQPPAVPREGSPSAAPTGAPARARAQYPTAPPANPRVARAADLIGEPPSLPSKPTPRQAAGGAAAGGAIIAEQLHNAYGTNTARLTDEQLRELLLIARGQYPAGGMTAQPAAR